MTPKVKNTPSLQTERFLENFSSRVKSNFSTTMVVKTKNKVSEERRFSIEMEESEGSVDEGIRPKAVTKPDSGLNI